MPKKEKKKQKSSEQKCAQLFSLTLTPAACTSSGSFSESTRSATGGGSSSGPGSHPSSGPGSHPNSGPCTGTASPAMTTSASTSSTTYSTLRQPLGSKKSNSETASIASVHSTASGHSEGGPGGGGSRGSAGGGGGGGDRESGIPGASGDRRPSRTGSGADVLGPLRSSPPHQRDIDRDRSGTLTAASLSEYPIGSGSTPRHKVGTARTSSNSSAGSVSLAPSASTPPASATVGSGATPSVSGSRSSFHFVLPSAASKLSKMISGSRHASVGKTHSTSSSLSSHSVVVPEAKTVDEDAHSAHSRGSGRSSGGHGNGAEAGGGGARSGDGNGSSGSPSSGAGGTLSGAHSGSGGTSAGNGGGAGEQGADEADSMSECDDLGSIFEDEPLPTPADDLAAPSTVPEHRDLLREVLEKAPAERTPADIEVLLAFLQNFQSFLKLSGETRAQFAKVMRLHILPSAHTVVRDTFMGDHWLFVINGQLQIQVTLDEVPPTAGSGSGASSGATSRPHSQFDTPSDSDTQSVCSGRLPVVPSIAPSRSSHKHHGVHSHSHGVHGSHLSPHHVRLLVAGDHFLPLALGSPRWPSSVAPSGHSSGQCTPFTHAIQLSSITANSLVQQAFTSQTPCSSTLNTPYSPPSSIAHSSVILSPVGSSSVAQQSTSNITSSGVPIVSSPPPPTISTVSSATQLGSSFVSTLAMGMGIGQSAIGSGLALSSASGPIAGISSGPLTPFTPISPHKKFSFPHPDPSAHYVLETLADDCQLLLVPLLDYQRILAQQAQNLVRVKDPNSGQTVLIKEQRFLDQSGVACGEIILRGSPEKLLECLIGDSSVCDPHYAEDFLLTQRVFLRSSELLAKRCFEWYGTYRLRDRAVRIVLLWVNNHFEDFERSYTLMAFLESFEERLEADKLVGPLKLLRIACSTKARRRCCTMLRPRRSTTSATTAICIPPQHLPHFAGGDPSGTVGGVQVTGGTVGVSATSSSTADGSTAAQAPYPECSSYHPAVAATISVSSAYSYMHAPAAVTISLPQQQHNPHFKSSQSQPLDGSQISNPASASPSTPSPLATSGTATSGSSSSLHQHQQPASAHQCSPLTVQSALQQPSDLLLVGGLECRAPLFVDAVEPDSPAWVAGLKRGDRLLEVGGTRLDPVHLPLPRVLALLGCSLAGGPSGGQRVDLVVVSDRNAYFELKARLKKPAKASLSSDLVIASSSGSGPDAADEAAAAPSAAAAEKKMDQDIASALPKMSSLIPALERTDSSLSPRMRQRSNTNVEKSPRLSRLSGAAAAGVSRLVGEDAMASGVCAGQAAGSARVSPGVSHPDLSCVAHARGLPQPSSGQRQTPSSEVDSPSPTGVVAGVGSPKSAARKAKAKAKGKRLLAAEDSLGANPTTTRPRSPTVSIFGLFQLPHFRRQMSSSADRGDSVSGSTSGSPKSHGTPTGAQPAGPLALTAKSRAVSTQDMAPQLDGAVKVFLADHTSRYLSVSHETTAGQVVAQALHEFGLTSASATQYSLCEVSVERTLEQQSSSSAASGAVGSSSFGSTTPSATPTSGGGGIGGCPSAGVGGACNVAIRQKRLPDDTKDLADRLPPNARYYLKSHTNTATILQPEQTAIINEILRESDTGVLHVPAFELAKRLTLEDFVRFREVQASEHLVDALEADGHGGAGRAGAGSGGANATSTLRRFQETSNREMFWCITEILTERNQVLRLKIVKRFLQIAKYCIHFGNYNSALAILSGVTYSAVTRLRSTLERLPASYLRLIDELQRFANPARNMQRYRTLVADRLARGLPMIPIVPIVKKDLCTIHYANRTFTDDGLVNFEKMRMLAREIRKLLTMCSKPYVRQACYRS